MPSLHDLPVELVQEIAVLLIRDDDKNDEFPLRSSIKARLEALAPLRLLSRNINKKVNDVFIKSWVTTYDLRLDTIGSRRLSVLLEILDIRDKIRYLRLIERSGPITNVERTHWLLMSDQICNKYDYEASEPNQTETVVTKEIVQIISKLPNLKSVSANIKDQSQNCFFALSVIGHMKYPVPELSFRRAGLHACAFNLIPKLPNIQQNLAGLRSLVLTLRGHYRGCTSWHGAARHDYYYSLGNLLSSVTGLEGLSIRCPDTLSFEGCRQYIWPVKLPKLKMLRFDSIDVATQELCNFLTPMKDSLTCIQIDYIYFEDNRSSAFWELLDEMPLLTQRKIFRGYLDATAQVPMQYVTSIHTVESVHVPIFEEDSDTGVS